MKKSNIADINIKETDKARYTPGDLVTINISIRNNSHEKIADGLLKLQAVHLHQVIDTINYALALEAHESKTMSIEWQAPMQNYQGYLLCIELTDNRGMVVAQDTIGVDVSSDWLKFPRYGYLCDYGKEEETTKKIAQMNRYHINVIEYYDWHALHHEPLPPQAKKESLGDWEDWAGRKIYGETLRDYLNDAHDRNMINMAYNMIYAGTDSFVKDKDNNGTQASSWQVYLAPENDKGEGAFIFHMGFSPSGNGSLYIMNPLNSDWQHHIFREQNHIFDVLYFDGWHGDTVGDWGKVTDALGGPLGVDEQGRPIDEIKDTYRQFLNAAKEVLGRHYLSFNPVGAQGIEQVNTSHVDALYTEFWPWDNDREGIPYDTYQSLVTEIERTMEESRGFSLDGKGKSLAVKAYINYYKSTGTMNEPGVLLCDAAVYAAGGSRLELGNGNHMLHLEYYPDDRIPMGEVLQQAVKRMADFTVAYENLLRDGQITTKNKVEVEKYPFSRNGQSNTIWVYTRADKKHEILHLINLLGTDNIWRDENGDKPVPICAKDICIKYYTDKEIMQVFMASFSVNQGMSIKLPFEKGQDMEGGYIIFQIPELSYWDMVYMHE